MTSGDRSVPVSVIIPTYNSSRVIGATVESVLRQTVPPCEILIMDDGSTDDTVAILKSRYPQVTVFQQQNSGVAIARSELCNRARGELVAFLDHDDLWHPRYLEMQCKCFRQFPNAVVFFTGHVNFYGYGDHEWSELRPEREISTELLSSLKFLTSLQTMSGNFGSA
ncbi:MAG: glycosyltransferase family A protein, partial [Terriglobales bacterium]